MKSFTSIKTLVLTIVFVFTFGLLNVYGQYTLRDSHVTMENGIITDYLKAYSYNTQDILIPTTLQGQTVVGLADASSAAGGIFYREMLATIRFPSTLQYLGDYSVYDSYVKNLIFSNCTTLTRIGKYAAYSTSLNNALSLANCSSLNTIETYAFAGCGYLLSVNLSGCTSLKNIEPYAFFNNVRTTSLDLTNCSSLDTINRYAFYDNAIATLNLTGCTSIVKFDENCFSRNAINSLDFSICPNLTEIAKEAFYANQITNVDLSVCPNIKTIGLRAFYGNPINSLNLSSCSKLTAIGEQAFGSNNLSAIDLSDCTSLTSINKGAFRSNPITEFQLPVVSGMEAFGWMDSDGNTYVGGDVVTNMEASYWVPAPYTLTDNDVEVIDGTIVSCSYNFALKNIIIPATLDGQTVIAIADAANSSTGIFANKGIAVVQFPNTIQKIGDFAFFNNILTSINLSNCQALTYIGESTFEDNLHTSIDLTANINLIGIGENAFYGYKLESVNVSGCTSLLSIGGYAFYGDIITNFTLPIHSIHSALGWRDEDGIIHEAGETVTDLYTSYEVPVPYTLTSDDVVVENGKIISCSYDYFFKDIIIPETLDNQTVIGIIDASYGSGVFYQGELLTLQLPAPMQKIGSYAFEESSLKKIDLALCTSLDTIGEAAFDDCEIDSVNFSACTNLLYIGEEAFSQNQIKHIDLSACTELIKIDYSAFYYNRSSSLNLSGCINLKYIGQSAFSSNYFNSLNLSSCTSLEFIGENAFYSNNYFGFNLPTNTQYALYGWRDSDNNTYKDGDYVSDLETYYEIPIPYTLNDNDVEVVAGYIISCSYSFDKKDIIIPETLDNQSIIGIANKERAVEGVFYYREIKSIQFPKSIQTIGKYAFYANYFSKLDLSYCTNLDTLGERSFSYNSDLKSLVLNGCTNLKYIGEDAFSICDLDSVFLGGCPSLETIDKEAFQDNHIRHLELSGCTKLKLIEDYAFDVEYEGGLTSLDFSDCSSLQRIGTAAFSRHRISSINFSGCDSLKEIGPSAFAYNQLPTVDLSPCTAIEKIDQSAFSTNKLTSVNFDECTSLKHIDRYAFMYNSISNIDLTSCTALIYIGDAFRNNSLSSFALPSPVVPGYIIENWKDGGGTMYPVGSTVTNLNNIYTANLTKAALANFWVSDGIKPLSGVTIRLSNIGTKITNNEGLAQFTTTTTDSLNYSAVAPGYVTVYDSIAVMDTVVEEEVVMTLCNDSIKLYETICEGEEVQFADSTYSSTGIFTKTYTNQLGCDSVTQLYLTVNPSYLIDTSLSICEGENVQIGDSTYSTTGTYETPLQNNLGCDSLIRLNLTVHPIYTIELVETLCEGESFPVGDTAYNQTGIHISNLKSKFGCDSIITLNLTVNPLDSIYLSNVICQGEQVNIGDSVYTETGIYVTNLINQFNCDSVITLELTVNPTHSTVLHDTICENDWIAIGDTSYNHNGTHVTSLTNQFGCDSTVVLELIVLPIDSVEINKIICEGDTVYLGSKKITEPGFYVETLSNKNLCDSVVSLSLQVIPEEIHLNKTICEGEFITIGDLIYTESGNYIDTLQNQLFCDSIVTLDLTVLPKFTNISQTICKGDTATLADKSYTQTGIYTDTLSNQLGCDSILVFDLIVNRTDSVKLTELICEGETFQVGDSIFSQTGNYSNQLKNTFGCDSTVSLSLTVNPVHYSVFNKEICEGETYLFNEVEYGTEGTFIDTFTNQYACDSIEVLNLIVHPTHYVLIKDTINHGDVYTFKGNDYTTSGLYADTLSNQNGCDSITSLLLFVYYEPVVFIPDANFKAELLASASINLNNDDEIQVSEAEAYTGKIQVDGKQIERLQGIEAFVNIDALSCEDNSLDSLNLSNNNKISFLNCSDNEISFLNFSKQNVLTKLNCSNNLINGLQTNHLSIIKEIDCSSNFITYLNLSQNQDIILLNCASNELSELNLRNGNNISLSVSATDNPNLSCVSVDYIEYSNTNWTNDFDAGIIFSTDCSAPDIAVNTINFIPSEVFPGDTLHLSWEVINFGNTDAKGGWDERISLVSGNGEQVYLNGNLKWSNVLLANDTVARNISLTVPEITYFSGPAFVKIVLIPMGLIEQLENIKENNTLVSANSLTLKEVLTLSITETSVAENFANSIRCFIKRSGNSDDILTVHLHASNNDVTVPDSVNITIGNNSQAFDLFVNNNNLFDGQRTVEILASATNLNSSSASIEITDDDIPALSVKINSDTLTEGDVIDVLISSNKTSDTTQIVGLASNKSSQWNYPANVTIPANQSSVSINIEVINNNTPEFKTEAWLSVSAKGYTSGNDTVLILDDDIPEIELVLLPDTISESAGNNAVKGIITRFKDNEDAMSISLSTDLPNQLNMTELVHFFPGEMEKQFRIDITDNTIVDGYRTAIIKAAVYIPSCSCGSNAGNGGIASAPLVIADNDGPSLQLSCSPGVLLEGAAEEGRLTISRNTSTDTPLPIKLSFSLPDEIQLQEAVTIPIGSTSVTVPIRALNDGIDDGQQNVNVMASAENHSPGTLTVLTTDQNKPDLSIPTFTVSTINASAKQTIELNATILNSGLLNASSGLELNLYLSSNTSVDYQDKILATYQILQAIPLNDSVDFWELVTLPDTVGNYYLIMQVNPNQIMPELLYNNNSSIAGPITITSDYTASANVAEETFISAQPVTITGKTQLNNGSPIGGKEIEVYVITQGVRRTISAISNSEGDFSVLFEPAINEVGHYTVGACAPGENKWNKNDEFDIMGFGPTTSEWITWYVEKGTPFDDSLEIVNYSNTELTNLRFELLQVPNGLDLQVNTISNMEGNTKSIFNFTITGNQVTEGRDYIQIPARIISDEGVNIEFNMYYFCQAKEGLLKTEPVNLETSFTKGKPRFVEFYAYNVGAGNTGEVTISLPDVDWMSLTTPAVIPNIAPGESSKITLRLNSSDNTELNIQMTGQIALNANNSEGLALPYRIECVSEETGSLIVDVVDEYTYSTAEAPHLADAHVKVTNPYTGKIVSEGYTDTNGLIEFTDIPEGMYELLVEAHQHDGFKKTILINPGLVSSELVFISFQAISYTWNVVPTEIEDEYKIELVMVYETNVPKPVVEAELPKEMPALVDNETFAFLITLTNHGLITAEDVDLGLPTDDVEYEFLFQDKKYTIPAKQSIQVPVVMQLKPKLKSAGLVNKLNVKNGTAGATSKCRDAFDYEYGWRCGPNKKYEMYKQEYSYKRCDNNDDNNTGGDDGGEGGGGDDDADRNELYEWLKNRQVTVPTVFGSGGGTGIPGVDDVISGISGDSGTSGYDPTSSDFECDPCKVEIAKFAISKIPYVSKFYEWASSAGESVMEHYNCFKKYSRLGMNEQDAFEKCLWDQTKRYIHSKIDDQIPSDQDILEHLTGVSVNDEIEATLKEYNLENPVNSVKSAVGLIDEITKVAATCYVNPPGVPNKSASLENIKPTMLPAMHQAITDMLYILENVDAEKTWLDEFWAPIDWQAKINFDEFVLEVDSFIENQLQFQAEDIDLIKQQLIFTDISEDDIDNFTARWNETLDAWSNNIYVPNTQYPNILNENVVDECNAKADSVKNYVQSRGFLTLDDLLLDALNTVEDEINNNQNSVCASVKLSITQKLVMTREAFRGTLSVYNGHETASMEEFELNLEITNLQGENCNDLFYIETEALSVLTGVDGNGSLTAQETGIATILFVPEKEAAPTTTQSYSFGGTISYIDPFTNTKVTKNLFPVTLEVHPSPDLYLHYFMQRDILGDDPLTEKTIEPIVPAELALMIENNGYGEAKNIRIESAQPELVDNEKGLLIDFELIGSNLQGQPANMGLIDIDFGTVDAQSTKVGQWWFTSSLLGHFVDYEAKLTHVDSRGNPNLSLISGATLHELIRSISVYGGLDDTIPDFLVNEIQDKDEHPDAIYLSQGSTVLDVYKAPSGSFDIPIKAPTFTNVLTFSPEFSGWNYIKLDDPGKGQFEIASITRNNDGQQIPLSNAWLTYITLPDGEEHFYENKFHIVDNFESLTNQSYTIIWVPKDSNPLEIVDLQGVPSQISTTPVTEFTVVFNKEIDLSTFTFEDINIQYEDGSNLSDNSITVTHIDTTAYRVNLSNLTSGDGYYEVEVQTNNINDLAGIGGLTGKMVSWSQALSAPAIQEFIGIPELATNQQFNSIQLRFNTEVDISTLTPDIFVLEKDGIPISTALAVSAADNSFTLFTVRNFESVVSQDGNYTLWVDLTKIRSLSGLFGIDVQFAEWIIDKTPPMVLSFTEIERQKLDDQHLAEIQIAFSEDIAGFTHANFELWKDNSLVPTAQVDITSVSGSIYSLSNFGTLTYDEGDYTLIVKIEDLTDLAGNTSSIQAKNNEYSWQVDRTAPLVVSNLAILPDLGISKTDHITTGDSLAISMNVNESHSNIQLYEVDGSNKTLLTELANVNLGALVISGNFPNGGQVKTEIVCSDTFGNAASVSFDFYNDKTGLQATINGAPLGVIENHPDLLSVAFSEEILASEFTNSTLSISHDGSPVSTDSIQINAKNNKEFTLKGFDDLNLTNGKYVLSIDLTHISKLVSGKYGSTTASTMWNIKIPNDPPVANAGNDDMVQQGQLYILDGSATYDPDGDSISFNWYAPEGIALFTPNSLSPSFVVPTDTVGTVYSFMLAVSDGNTMSTDKANISINRLILENNISASTCFGEVYNFGTQNLTTSGIYTEIFTAIDGSDSTVVLDLTVNPTDSIEISEVICDGEQIKIGDSTYDQTGIFVSTLSNKFGCDSVVTLDLTVNPVDSVSISEVICEGEQIDIGDSTYDQTGIFVSTLSNKFGCDSVVTLDLTVNPVDSVSITEVICEGEQFNIGDATYTESGIFVTTLSNKFGCDSLVTLDLSVNPVDSVSITEVICEGEQIVIGDATYTESGIFVSTLSNKLGCDSVVTLDLTVNPVDSVSITEVICEGEQIVIGDATYTESGIFVLTLSNKLGCDSVITLDLTVNPMDSVSITEVICEGEQIVIGDATYTESGIFVLTLSNKLGCDSVITLDLTVNPSVTKVLNKSICEGESYTMGGKSYSSSGSFTTTLENSHGCDSVVTLNLNVNSSSTTTLNKTICDGDSFVMGGKAYSAEGVYTTTLANKYGCDSIVSLNLSVKQGNALIVLDTIVEGESYLFNGTLYMESGTYSKTLTNNAGCDSIVKLELTVLGQQLPFVKDSIENIEIHAGNKDSAYFDLTKVFENPANLILSYSYFYEGGILPEWITSAIADSIWTLDFTPELTDTGCYIINISAFAPTGQSISNSFNICVIKNLTDIKERKDDFTVKIYPNPTKGKVTFEIDGTSSDNMELMVLDVSGRQILYKTYFAPPNQVTLDLSQHKSGIYVVRIKMGENQYSKKLILDRK